MRPLRSSRPALSDSRAGRYPPSVDTQPSWNPTWLQFRTLDPENARTLLAELRASDARLHGWSDNRYENWQLSSEALEVIIDRVRPGDRTLETGAGYSTVVFASIGAQHIVVTPEERERARILAWCDAHSVDTATTCFIIGRSQDVLPSLDDLPLDFALIDGDHAFPTPFLDWYYSAERLRVGGLVMIDDVQLRTGRMLDDFLRSELGHWRQVVKLHRTVVYEKLTPAVIEPAGWVSQPWCTRPTSLVGRVRHRVRARTRLAGLARRFTRSEAGVA